MRNWKKLLLLNDFQMCSLCHSLLMHTAHELDIFKKDLTISYHASDVANVYIFIFHVMK